MMPWVKLDDQFPDHPKVLAAGPLASWLYVCGLSYCGRLLTDGFIPEGQVRKLADVDNATELASRLVEVGLWDREKGGYRVHDYLDYQPSKERVVKTREVRAEAGSKGGKQRASNLLESSSNEATSVVEANSNPVPVPTPVPDSRDPEPEGADAPDAREKAPAGFEQFWAEYPRGHGSRAKSLTVWRRVVRKADVEAVLSGLAAWKGCDRWERGIIVSAEKWLGEKRWEDEPPNDGPARASPNGTAGERRATPQGFARIAQEGLP